MIRVCMIVFSQFPGDVRVRREAEALIAARISVDIICLRAPNSKRKDVHKGINIYRLPIVRKYGGKFIYIWQNIFFFLLSFIKLNFLYIKNHYHVIHVHNMPDFLVFVAILPRLFGAKIILDLHDPMPELMMTKYSFKNFDYVIRLISFIEKKAIAFAALVFTPNKSFRNIFISRGSPAEKIHILMNSPQEEIFFKEKKHIKFTPPKKDNFVIMYHGALFERQGIDIALQAIHLLKKKIPRIKFIVHGYGDYEKRFLELVKEMKLEDIVDYRGYALIDKIVETIPFCHVGIIPNKMTPFTNINLPVRIFEYICLGKPVIAPRTKGIQDYFDEESLFFFEPDDAEDLANVLSEFFSNPEKAKQKWERAHKIYYQYRWELQKKNMINLLNDLVSSNE